MQWMCSLHAGFIGFSLVLLGIGAPMIKAQQGGGLKFLNPAGGGQVVYGSLENQKSQDEGMVYMLRQVHSHFGDKPKLGKLVAARDGSSLAAFFTLNDNLQTHQPQSGLVLIESHNGHLNAAVAYDKAERFGKSEPALIRSLMAAWHPAGGSSSGAVSSTRSGQMVTYVTQRLYPATAGDRSITIDLPPLWKITGLGGGSVTAEGPNGEFIGVALIWQNMQRALTPDLFESFVNMSNILRQRNGKPQGKFRLVSQQPLPPGPYTRGRPTMAQFTVDFNDQFGLRKGNARIAFAAAGALFVTESWIPVSVYETEQPMVTKIINTARQNRAVISAEGARDLDRIRQQAAANEIQAKAINERREAQAGQYEQHRQELNARNSQDQQKENDFQAGSLDFQNYVLDRSVIQSTETHDYATTSNKFADAIVSAAPDKFVITTNRALIAKGDF